MALIIREGNNKRKIIRLFLIQISINKTIKKIQKILDFLDRKILFIKKKIFEILQVNIDEVHILFIFQGSTFEHSSFNFCNLYRIPFILYNHSIHNFISNNCKNVDYNKLLKETSFSKNKDRWKSSLEYNIDIIEEKDYEEEGDMDEEFEENDIYYDDEEFEQNDVINNKNFSMSYFD